MNWSRRKYLWILGAAAGVAAAAERDLTEEWRRIAQSTDGLVGVAALHLSHGPLVSFNGNEKFPLASVCKVPVAMNILALVDEGKLRLDQQIEVLPRDVNSEASAIATRWPAQRQFPLRELVEQMVAQSDNTAVETLFRIGGGAPAIAARMRTWNIQGVRVDRSERQWTLDRHGVTHYPPPDQWTDKLLNALIAQATPDVWYRATLRCLADPRDTGTPIGTVDLFARLFRGEALSRESTALLIDILKSTTTSPTRLKGLLPAGTVVAHKTGSTSSVKGLTAATNDSGVIFLPRGGQLAISVYLKASTRSAAERDHVIARMARAAFDFYS